MKALPPRTGLRALLVSAQERDREEWEDEGSSDEELIKAIEVSNTQQACSRQTMLT